LSVRHPDRGAAGQRPACGDLHAVAADVCARTRFGADHARRIYYGAQYGGSTTAILVNVPGEISSVVTCIDGYQMARQGRAGSALSVAAVASLFAGCVGTLVLAALAAPLTELAFKFGPAENFSLMVLGLVGATVSASQPQRPLIGLGDNAGLAARRGSRRTRGRSGLSLGNRVEACSALCKAYLGCDANYAR
jgi:hypothetical protein